MPSRELDASPPHCATSDTPRLAICSLQDHPQRVQITTATWQPEGPRFPPKIPVRGQRDIVFPPPRRVNIRKGGIPLFSPPGWDQTRRHADPQESERGPLWLDSCAKSFKRSWSGSDCGSGPCSENGVIPRLLLLPCLAGVLAGTGPRPSDCQWMVPRHGKPAASTSRVRVAGGSPPAIRESLLLPRRSDRPSPPTGPDPCRGKSLPRRPIPSRRWSHRWFCTAPCY